MKTDILIQARTSSSRFPEKVIQKPRGMTILELLIKRVKQAKFIDDIIIVTSSDSSDDIIEKITINNGVKIYRGSLENVLDRYYKACQTYKTKVIVRITGDCPLIDPQLIDLIVEKFKFLKVDYLSNTIIPKFPDGQDVEVFSFHALKTAWANATLNSEREHVTPFIYKNSSFYGQKLFNAVNYDNEEGDYSKIRMTVDYKEDFELIKALIEKGGTNLSWKSFVEIIENNDLEKVNIIYKRNQGYLKSLEND